MSSSCIRCRAASAEISGETAIKGLCFFAISCAQVANGISCSSDFSGVCTKRLF
jgi:hypothetical protein